MINPLQKGENREDFSEQLFVKYSDSEFYFSKKLRKVLNEYNNLGTKPKSRDDAAYVLLLDRIPFKLVTELLRPDNNDFKTLFSSFLAMGESGIYKA
jgi:hypothetical protein